MPTSSLRLLVSRSFYFLIELLISAPSLCIEGALPLMPRLFTLFVLAPSNFSRLGMPMAQEGGEDAK